MKIAFKIISTYGGADKYYSLLRLSLNKNNLGSNIYKFAHIFEFCPFLLRFFSKSSNANIVHSNAECGWAFKEKNKPLIITIHHNVFDKDYRKTVSPSQKIFHSLILRPNIKKSLKVADKIIAVSSYTKNSIVKTFGYENKIKVIYNGIDTNKFKPMKVKSTDKRFKLLFVGNLIRRKGVDLLPKIMEKLGDEYVLYYTSGLRTKVPNDFNLPNMIPLGKLSEKDLIREYNKCDALLFPTRLEGFGYAVAEAMACGKPIIATNCSSIPELVENGKNGFLCKMDNVDDFVEKIKKISVNQRFLRNVSDINRGKIKENFSLLSLSKNFSKEYLNLQ